MDGSCDCDPGWSGMRCADGKLRTLKTKHNLIGSPPNVLIQLAQRDPMAVSVGRHVAVRMAQHVIM